MGKGRGSDRDLAIAKRARRRAFRLSARTCAMLAPAVVGSLGLPDPAAAQHRYGYAYQNGTFAGAEATLTIDCLSVPNPTTDFINNDLWMVRGSEWVEAGIIQGWFRADPAGGSFTATTPHFFWGDNNSAGYYSHLGPEAPASVNHVSRIRQDVPGTGKWNVTIGGYTGTSRTIFTTAATIETGTEETTIDGRATNAEAGLAYWTSSGSRVGQWGNAQLVQSSPPYANWKNPHTALLTTARQC